MESSACLRSSGGALRPLKASAAQLRLLDAVCSQELPWLLMIFVPCQKPPHHVHRCSMTILQTGFVVSVKAGW